MIVNGEVVAVIALCLCHRNKLDSLTTRILHAKVLVVAGAWHVLSLQLCCLRKQKTLLALVVKVVHVTAVVFLVSCLPYCLAHPLPARFRSGQCSFRCSPTWLYANQCSQDSGKPVCESILLWLRFVEPCCFAGSLNSNLINSY